MERHYSDASGRLGGPLYDQKEDENGFTIYQTASYEKMEGLGYLCSFEKSDAWMNYGAGENLIAYTEDGTLYYLMQPTDVACDTEDQDNRGRVRIHDGGGHGHRIKCEDRCG